jgi:diguanylate cyclase
VEQISMLLLSDIATPAFHDSPVVRVVEQGYRLRVLVFGLAFIAAAAVLSATGDAFLVLTVLGLNACAWPSLARMFALRSADPRAIEKRSLLFDSSLGGAWVALMQFNLLPSVLLTIVLSCDKLMAGGWSLLLRGLVVQAAACILTLVLHGLMFMPQSSTLQILASLPLLVAYPLAVCLRVYRHNVASADAASELAGETRIA